MWVARDGLGTLQLYLCDIPLHREGYRWTWEYTWGDPYSTVILEEDYPQFKDLTWSDEPVKIDLIKYKCN